MANEKRSRTNLVAGALSVGLSVADTAMTSAGLADLAVIDATNHAAISIFAADSNGRILSKEIVYVTAHTAASTSATIVRAQEGTSAQTWASGVTWGHAPTTRDLSGGKAAFAKRTAGNVTITTTATFTNIDTALDLVLTAAVGDVIEYGLSGRWSNQSTQGHIDVATIVSAARVNYLSGITSGEATSLGVPSWFGDSALRQPVGGSVMYSVVSGDLSSGTVTLRVMARVTGSKDVIALSTSPLHVWAKNHGPQIT